MDERYYENFFDCKNCGTKNISALRKMRCPHCGASKVTQIEENDRMVEITDAYGLQLARSPMNWACSYCYSINMSKDEKCISCGSAKSDEVVGNFFEQTIDVNDYHVEHAHDKLVKPDDIIVTGISIVDDVLGHGMKKGEIPIIHANPGSRTIEQIPESCYKEKIERQNDYVDKASSSFMKTYKTHIVITLGIILIILGAYSTRAEYSGVVESFQWTRTINVERYSVQNESGWTTPYDAYSVSSSQRIHHYDDIYQTKTVTEEVPYTVTEYSTKTVYKKMGNGSTRSSTERVPRSVTKYRSQTICKSVKVGERPVYRTYYNYLINRWVYSHTLTKVGFDKTLIWPDFIPVEGDKSGIGKTRQGSKNQVLSVGILWKIKDKNIRKNFDVKTFDKVFIGDKVKVHYIMGVPIGITFELKGEMQ